MDYIIYLKDIVALRAGFLLLTCDHHYMVYTMLKTTFQKSEPKQLISRDFKSFYFESYENDLLENMVIYDRSYDKFNKNFTTVLNKHAPTKRKWLCGNQKTPY